jgi:thiamine-phosphate pyrophosphorylase
MMTTPQNPFSGVISFERPYEKDGAPACGIYLVSPVKLRINLFAQQLRHAVAALNESRYQKNMHALEMRFPKAIYDKERAEANALVAICKRNGVVPVVRNDIGLCIECQADGVILDDPANVAEARRILGDSAIIGVDCGNDKKKAKKALEAGVDYVSFSRFFAKKDSNSYADLSLLEWWSMQTHLPAVATGSVGGTRAIEMVRAGAGFIAPGSWVWNYAKGPKQAIYWLQACVEHAAGEQRVN